MKITLTLNKANKLFQKLKQIRRNFPNQFLNVPLTTNSFTQKAFPDRAVSDLTRMAEDFSKSLAILTDVYGLKEALFSANVQCGVSAALGELGLLREQANILQGNLTSIRNNDAIHLKDLTTEKVKELRTMVAVLEQGMAPEERVYRTPVQVTLAATTEQELAGTILTIQRRINLLEDTVARLNASTELEYDFHPDVAELLGLV